MRSKINLSTSLVLISLFFALSYHTKLMAQGTTPKYQFKTAVAEKLAVKKEAKDALERLLSTDKMGSMLQRKLPLARLTAMVKYKRAINALDKLENAEKMTEQEINVQVVTFHNSIHDFLSYTSAQDPNLGCCLTAGRGCQTDCRGRRTTRWAICGCYLEASACLVCRFRGADCCP